MQMKRRFWSEEWDLLSQIGEIAGKVFERAQVLEEERKTWKALDLAHLALSLYKEAEADEKMAEVYVFLGKFEKAKEYLKFARQILISSASHCSERGYSTAFVGAHIDALDEKIKHLSRRETPPMMKTLRIGKDCQPEIKLVAFDLDGTLTTSGTHVWTELNEKNGTTGEAGKLAEEYRRGEFSYHCWATQAFSLLTKRGMDRKGLEEALAPITLTPGVWQTIHELKKEGKILALISGSLDIILNNLFPKDIFDEVYINKVYFQEDSSLGFEATSYGDGQYKAEALEEIAGKYGFLLRECAYVGDNLNDLEIARKAGLSIAFNSKSEQFKKACTKVVEGNMTGILAYVKY